jgi:hypothetical protein
MLWALVLFHSVMLERKRYGRLGWNGNYDWQ